MKKNNKIRFDLVSSSVETFNSVLNTGILNVAQEKDLAEFHAHDLHNFSDDKWNRIDDSPFGGGAGMLIKCQPVFDCINKLKEERNYDEIIFLTPEGETLNQSIANELSLKSNIILLSGRFKGIDQRIRENLITREISIGDYVLTGGELPSLVLLDSVTRLIPGVLGDSDSALKDTFMDNKLEPPQYTRPADYYGLKVPDILLSGDHKAIEKWRNEKALEKTKQVRPDLLDS